MHILDSSILWSQTPKSNPLGNVDGFTVSRFCMEEAAGWYRRANPDFSAYFAITDYFNIDFP